MWSICGMETIIYFYINLKNNDKKTVTFNLFYKNMSNSKYLFLDS
jgi:hypothetical protein